MSVTRTRLREFPDEVEKIVQWAYLVAPVAPHPPEGTRGRPLFSPETMCCAPIHAAVVCVERSGDGREQLRSGEEEARGA